MHMAIAFTATGVTERADSRSDDQLFAAYGRGDRRAFDTLYGRYKDPLYGYLLKNCRVEALAGEMFQDVWLRVISSSGRFERRGKFRAWLFTLAHNRLVDYYRKSEHEYETESVDRVATDAHPERLADSSERYSRLEAVVRSLPFEQRQAFYLREECGFAVREIAEIQEIGVEAAKSRLRYAYAKLREKLQDES